MGKDKWQTPDQKVFVDNNIPLYVRSEGENLRDFWKKIMGEWFEAWPLSDPPAELVTKEETFEKAQKVWKARKVEVSVPQRCSV